MNNVPLPEPDQIFEQQHYYGGIKMHAHAAAVSAADNAALQTTLADSRAYVERLTQRVDGVLAENAALRAELLREHQDHKQTVEDAATVLAENRALRERVAGLERNCRTCRHYVTRNDAGCGSIAVCTDGDRYVALPVVQLWKNAE